VAAQIQDGSNIWPADRPGPVFVVGRAGMDLYPIPVGSKIKMAHQFQADLGGSAGNIAVALARRGVPVQLLSAESADPAGDFVRAQLHAYGAGLRRYLAANPGSFDRVEILSGLMPDMITECRAILAGLRPDRTAPDAQAKKLRSTSQ
jgi:hypothetical protein